MEKSEIMQAVGLMVNIRRETGEYMATLHAWGDLPEIIPVEHASRLLATMCQQDAKAIEAVLQNAIRNFEVPFWGLSDEMCWVPNYMRAHPKFAGKIKYKPATANAPATVSGMLVPDLEALQFEYMGLNPSDAVRLLQKRGRKVPESLLDLLKDSPVPPDQVDPSADSQFAAGTQDGPLPLPKERQQERRIIDILRSLGMDDPLALPPRQSGKPGPKAVVRKEALREAKLFTASSFDKTWERMRKNREIQGAD